MPDYYGQLGLQRGAALDEVKAAFRKLALKHHPDRWVLAEQGGLARGHQALHARNRGLRQWNPLRHRPACLSAPGMWQARPGHAAAAVGSFGQVQGEVRRGAVGGGNGGCGLLRCASG